MAVTIAGKRFWLWRAVDSEGEILNVLVQSRRNTGAAVRVLRRLLRNISALGLFRRIQFGKDFARRPELSDRDDVWWQRRALPCAVVPKGSTRGKRWVQATNISLPLSRAAGVFAALMLFNQRAHAADDLIELYIAEEGGCSSPSRNPLSFVLVNCNIDAPFGKAAENWSDDDLSSLKTVLEACQATSARLGNPYLLQEIKQQSADLLTSIPKIVAQARD